ncbi:MAG: diguanylate cyclase [Actinoplanes sp.]
MPRSKLLVALSLVYVAAMIGCGVAASAGLAIDTIAGPAMFLFDLVAVVYGVRVSRHPSLDGPTRRACRMFAAGFALTFAVSLVFAVTGTNAFPQLGDALHLLATIVFLAAFLLVPLREASTRERWKTLLDAGTVVLGASMVLWYLIVGPALSTGHDSAGLILAAACYPVVDLLVLFALARAALRGAGRISRSALVLIVGAMGALFVGDAYIGYTQAHVDVVHRSTFAFVSWLSTHFLLACGAVELWRHAGRPVAATTTFRRGLAGKIPYAGVAVGYALMAVAAVRENAVFPWLGLVLGGLGITSLVVLRQVLAQTETIEAAETDGLTGLANRARLHHELARALHRAGRSGGTVAVLLIDLNGFKRINDTLGHQAGDDLLVAVAGAMRRSVRRDDLVGRLGGDEFAVVVHPFGDEKAATSVAQRIIEAVAGPFVVGARPMSASASIGVAVSGPDAHTADELLHRADLAMYDRKRNGGGWQAWHPGLQPAAPEPDPRGADLENAIEAGQLRLSYRPIRSLAGLVVGATAEVSWEHPDLGTIGPDVLGPLAERLGLAERIGAWTLARVAGADAGYVVVPVTPQQLREPRFAADVRPGLVLELPGSVLTEEPDTVVALRALGARVAVRDFGTSYAALGELSRVPVEFLRLPWSPAAPDVAVAILRVGQALGLTTLVGDVEVPADAVDLGSLAAPPYRAMI